jgi:hypothetical protein
MSCGLQYASFWVMGRNLADLGAPAHSPKACSTGTESRYFPGTFENHGIALLPDNQPGLGLSLDGSHGPETVKVK